MKIDSVAGLSQNISSSSSDIKIQSTEAVSNVGTEQTTSGQSNIDRSDEVKEINDEMVQKAVEQANKSLKMYDKKIERVVHDVTKTVMYTVKDTKTDEVIREFPPRKIQDMIAKMWELAGLFVDKKA